MIDKKVIDEYLSVIKEQNFDLRKYIPIGSIRICEKKICRKKKILSLQWRIGQFLGN
jgi:hypothetical protein